MTVESTILDLLCSHIAKYDARLPVAYQNTPFSPPGSEYLEVTFLPNTNRNPFIRNDDPTHYVGLFQVTVVSPSGSGEIRPRELAGNIVNHFAKGTRLQNGSVIVKVTAKPSAAPAMQDEGRHRVPVSIPYQCIHI